MKDITPVKSDPSMKLEAIVMRWIAHKLGISKEYEMLRKKLSSVTIIRR